jgi:peptide/nickel transport system permease protein
MATMLGKMWVSPGGQAGLAILASVAACAAAAPLLFPEGPWVMVGRPLVPPFATWLHIFGTDMLGRDLLTSLLYGAQASLAVGAGGALGSALIGTTLGALAGYRGGLVENLIMRLTELLQGMPAFVFTVVLVAVLSPSLASTTLAIIIVGWSQFARVARGEFVKLRHREFVSAAIVAGLSDVEVAVRQILPNVLPPLIVLASLKFAFSVLTESGISFLGLGDPDRMSWGYLIGAGHSLLRQAWWISFFPGAALALTAIGVHLLSEALTHALGTRPLEAEDR